MNYQRIIQEILSIGQMMVGTGAEIFRTEDSLYRMLESYGFSNCNAHAIPSNIQVSAEAPTGEIITQICHIRKSGIDLTQLDKLNDLCRYICENHPDEKEIRERRIAITKLKPMKPALTALAAMLGGGGFTVFFGGGFIDCIIGCIVSVFIALGGMQLAKKESNGFIYNLILACISELFILFVVDFYPNAHPESITDGIVMMLISALSTTNGIRDMLQRDILSGIQNILGSIMGAAGIACGIALGMMVLNGHDVGMILNPSIPAQVITCGLAGTGFALWFNVPRNCIAFCGIGSLVTWLIYAVCNTFFGFNNFISTLVGACFVAAFAYVMARVKKMPSTVFLSSTVIPLIPGPNLYYMMYAVTRNDSALLRSETVVLLETCLGIALGFLVFDAIMRYTSDLYKNSIFAK
ncbi:MAG: threonine/serine exporter ThrE family protein [Lachnospiraceae bacterium]